MSVGRLCEIKEGPNLTVLVPTFLGSSRPLWCVLGPERELLALDEAGVGGAFGSLPGDLTLLFVLRHREEIVPVSDSRVVSLLGLVRGVCTVWHAVRALARV